MRIYNTATKKIEKMTPLNPPTVTLYTCGPTVYDFTHLGHMRKYTNDDLLKHTLEYNSYTVNHVMNVTDVGHLVSDADEGEDKMEKGARKYGKTVWEVAQFYTDFFTNTMNQLHISHPSITCKATEHIPDMISLIQILVEKGFTYETAEALYFDVTKFSGYGQLSKQNIKDKKEGAREDVIVDSNKKHPADFALWFKRVGRFVDHTMHWSSPWGEGFPGWHIECSAMSMKYLGPSIDIHTGGTDHIPVHHENEIAQSEAATGKPFVHYWVHHEMLNVDGKKMSKSLGNFYTIDDIKKQGIDPISLKLLFYQTHYRQPMNFTWESAKGAQEAYKKLKEFIASHPTPATKISDKTKTYQQQFTEHISNDLQVPQAVATMWEMIKSDLPDEEKTYLLFDFDRVLQLDLQNTKAEQIPDEVVKLAEEREQKRKERDFTASDVLRKKIEEKGYRVKDSSVGFSLQKN